MPDQNLPTPPSPDSAWLEQYYTSSKTDEPAGDISEAGYSVTAHIAVTDKYAVGEEVGSGGMKSVRRARDRNASRDVAMAVLHDGRRQPRFIRRFVREARLTAALEHPNIVPVHDIGVGEDGRPYFTMKLLGGESLHSVLQKLDAGDEEYRQRYTLSRLLQIFLGAGNAVAFAHSRGVIHLDLKPANIQVGGFGEVLVVDWGLAKVMERPGALVLPEELRVVHTEGVVRGTPGFMAPEQSRGEYSKLDERTDVYALGVVLLALLTGKMPAAPHPKPLPGNQAKGTKSESLLARGVEGQDEGPGAKALFRDRPIPDALQAVVLKATATGPASRYQSVHDLLREVQAFLGGYATSAQQASTLTVLWLLVKRQKLAVALLAASFIVIVTISVTAFVRITHSERATRQALVRIEEEQAANRRLGVLAAPRVFQKAGDLLRAYDVDGALEQLNFTLALDATLSTAWTLKGWLHIGRLEFEEALVAFERAARKQINRRAKPLGKPQNFEELALKYRDLPLPLTKEQRLELVAEIVSLGKGATEWQQALLAQFFAMQNQQEPDFELIKAELKLLNPDSKTLELIPGKNDAGLTLQLRGDKITVLLPLIGLPITSLDLSEAVGAELGPLRALNALTELRVTRWPPNLYARLWPLTQLARVVVASNDVVVLQNDLHVHMTLPPQVVGE